MTGSQTPETDKEISVGLENADRECVSVEFARRIERERDEAREEMADALQEVDLRLLDLERMKQERDRARQKNSKLRYIAERAQTICQRLVSPQYADAGAVKQLRAELDQLKGGAK
jgi:uncharacterized protein (DUF3084 family)